MYAHICVQETEEIGNKRKTKQRKNMQNEKGKSILKISI